jgi:protein SCO1
VRVNARVLILALFVAIPAAAADREFPVKGMIIAVNESRKEFTVSHERIAGLMESMTMPFQVRDAGELKGLAPGAIVDFTLVITETSGYATRIAIRRYESVEQDPRTARRLSVMKRLSGVARPPMVLGTKVPDFTLTNQARRRVTLSELSGKVIALNFIYTRCALPQFCVRMSNTFSALQRRFQSLIGRDLVLLTITFDPARDTPEVLATYAAQWQADPAGWHFLTGTTAEIGRVSALFGQEAFPDEGLMNHVLHTAVIDRRGLLVANIEGNQFTAEQLGDLVAATLR